MKLTKKEIKALEQSIDHWEKDIIQQFKKGRKVRLIDDYFKYWEWVGTGAVVQNNSTDCALCKLIPDDIDCEMCPYTRFYEHACDSDGHWSSFNKQPCLRTANAMKKSLQKILDSQEV